ncbi:hypothetical protein GCM10023315_03420 [Algibacter aquimarinus]|uniref:Uncharacterized protein n=1 Tax=Algibacter aquimarinus TaxID=1136748 RepID=A0ABP9H290_9FLAO
MVFKPSFAPAKFISTNFLFEISGQLAKGIKDFNAACNSRGVKAIAEAADDSFIKCLLFIFTSFTLIEILQRLP